MNTSRRHQIAVLFATVFCLLTAVAYGQRVDKRGKKEFTFKGIVESVDANGKSVTVTSENIPGWLNSVKNTYKVDNSDVLKTVQPGDRVTAKVYEGDFKVLYELRPVPPEDTPISLGKKRFPQ